MLSEFDLALSELRDETRPLSSQALVRLSGASREQTAAFARAWRDLGQERKREAITQMVELAEANFELDFAALLRSCLDDQDPLVRKHAIEGLWEDERPSLVEPLIRILSSDPDVQVRATAAVSLGRFVFMGECEELEARRAEAIRQALKKVIRNPQEDPEVVRRAIESIAYVNDDEVRGIIDNAYEHGDGLMRESAVFAMGRSAELLWADTVLEELQDLAAGMRYEAARACGEMQLKRAVGPLIKLVQDPDREVQGMAVWALGQIGGERARLALERWAESDDESLSTSAQEALDELDFAVRPMDLLVHEEDETGYTEFELMDGEADDEYGDLPDVDDDEEWTDDVIDLERDQ
jgi:HEAT repeat protein